jgi:3-keto-5-aminohexanoate cleavage enzyme
MEKLIITVAPTGSVPKKKDNPNVPVTTGEIIECGLRCEDEGASIIHLHMRDEKEDPSDDKQLFQEVVGVLRKRSNLILQISTGGRAGADLKSRVKRLTLLPEMASLTTGSVNFPSTVYINTPQLIEGLAREMRQFGIKPEMEIFDISMIYNALALHKMKLVDPPLHFNFVMGLKGAVPASIEHLVHFQKCLPLESTWTVSAIGAAQLRMCMHAVLMGGHVRVGLEDNIYYGKGKLATNDELVKRINLLAREFGRDVATPDEARVILSLNPRNRGNSI